jgi:hypothetical protein
LAPIGGEDIRKGYRRVSVAEKLCTMYENGKMRPLKTIL